MSKTKAQLEKENEALRAVLAAIGEAAPPLPADPAKMNLYGLECATRLSAAAYAAASLAACDEDYLAVFAQQETASLRRQWAAPLHYDAEHPDRRDCTCGHRGSEHIYSAPSPCTQCGCLAFSTATAGDGTPAPQGCRS